MLALKKVLHALSPNELKTIRAEIDQMAGRVRAVEIIESRMDESTGCPHCGSHHRVRNGSANGLQRYRCKGCRRTFNALTGTPLARLHQRGKWAAHMQALIDGLTLDGVADRLSICHDTAFRWRHRFLETQQSIQAKKLNGLVEADQTYMLESNKGKKVVDRKPRKRGGKAKKRGLSKEQVPILVVRDRSGATLSTRLEADNADTITKVMEWRLASDAILCTDSSKTLAAVAKRMNVPHRPVNLAAGVRVIERVFHVQNVNAFDSRLKGWMVRFKGVATKYLESYLGWFRTLDRSGDNVLKPASFLASAMAV
ncbi:MAG: IS1595 family transposase [Gammaproteobacteria bacterium]|nr:IS1595 family transposase [Gammaproteobacteria bacterium]